MSGKDIKKILTAPFANDEIEWRVQQAGMSRDNKPYAMVLCYVTNRAIQDRLDDAFGMTGWQNKFNDVQSGAGHIVECGIGAKINGDWIWKWDAAGETQVEAIKGGRSDSMKRAAVHWGIGRYLYRLDAGFAACFDDRRGRFNQTFQKTEWNAQQRKKVAVGNPVYGSWNPPELPEWALPGGQQ